MPDFARIFSSLNLKAKYLVLLLSGLIAVFGLAPFFLWPLYAIAIIVLFYALDDAKAQKRPKHALFWRSFIFGFGYFAFGMFWVGAAFLVDAAKFAWLLPFAMTALPAGLSIYFGLFGLLYGALESVSKFRIFWFAACFGLMEYLRGHLFTGIPWNLTAYIFEAGGILSQVGSIIGTYGTSTLAIFIFCSFGILIQKSDKFLISLNILIIGIVIGFGFWRISKPVEFVPNGQIIAAGQTGFTQKELWDEANVYNVINAYFAQLKSKVAQDSDVIIWPEGAFPFEIFHEEEFLKDLNKLLDGKILLLGAPRSKMQNSQLEYYNSMVILKGTKGQLPELFGVYDKHHLVPFGEYLPLRPAFNAIGISSLVAYGTDFTKGEGGKTMQIPGFVSFDPRICYEIIFSNFNKSKSRAELIVNVSVDAWYGDFLGPDQHYNQARWRSIEEGLPMVRAASGGWTGIIDSYGRPAAEFRIGNKLINSPIPKALPPSFYSQFPELVFFLLIVVFGAIAYLRRVRD